MPATLTQEVTQLKRPSTMRKFLKNSSIVLSLKRNYSLRWVSTWSLSNVLPCYRQHLDRACCHPCNNKMISHGVWAGLLCTTIFMHIKKEQKQVSIKRFLPKRNLADVGMNQWMHWRQSTQTGMPHGDMHSIARPWFIIQQPFLHKVAVNLVLTGVPLLLM